MFTIASRCHATKIIILLLTLNFGFRSCEVSSESYTLLKGLSAITATSLLGLEHKIHLLLFRLTKNPYKQC